MNSCIFRLVIFLACSIGSILGSVNAHAGERQHALEYLANKWRVSPDIGKIIVKSVMKHSGKHGIDPYLIMAIIEQESGYRHHVKATTGSSGLMQVVSYWHRDKIAGRNIMDINVNVEVGSQILKDCMNRRKTMKGILGSCYNGNGDPGYTEKIIVKQKRLRQQIYFGHLQYARVEAK